jgi:hypothetical protein
MMPLYFFHVQDGSDDQAEPEALELSGDAEAHSEALEAAGTMIREFTSQHRNAYEWSMRVVGHNGARVCEVQFSARLWRTPNES